MRPASYRVERYKKKVRGLVIPGQTARYAPTAADRIKLEMCVKTAGITPMMQFSYIAYLEQLLKHDAGHFPMEGTAIHEKWRLRGLDSSLMVTLGSCIGISVTPYVSPVTCVDLSDVTWIVADPAAQLTVTADNVNFTAMPQVLDTYVYKDYGVAHFPGNFEHRIDFRHSLPAEAAVTNPWVMANVIDDYDNFDPFDHIQLAIWPLTRVLRLRQRSGGVATFDVSNVLTPNTWYYLTITRVGVVVTCEIYSSEALRIAGGAGDVDTIAVIQAPAGSYRYLYVMNGGIGFAGSATGDVHCLQIIS